MKRLITMLTLVALISGISVAAFSAVTEDVVVTWEVGRWIRLWIPPDDRAVALVSDEGVPYPIFGTPEGERPLSVFVWTNLPGGFVLTVEAGTITAPPGATNIEASFDIQGGALAFWHDLSIARTLLSSTTPGSFYAHNIDYQFRFDPAYHPPGDYSLTIIFTATGR